MWARGSTAATLLRPQCPYCPISRLRSQPQPQPPAQWQQSSTTRRRNSGQSHLPRKNHGIAERRPLVGNRNRNREFGFKKKWALVGSVRSSAQEGVSEGGIRNFREWVKRKAEESRRQQVSPGEKLMRMVATATSAPVAQYIAEPETVLHVLDPRVKQAWLFALVFLPSRAHVNVRLALVAFLLLATVWSLPRRVWQDQLGRMAFLTGLLFIFTALGSDGAPPMVQTRTPPPSFEGLPEILESVSGYKYVLFKLGPLQLTRKGLGLATAAACLSFTILQSATLCLTTTTPEQMAAGLRWFLAPSSKLGVPVDEIILTLLLSLRFLGVVFDEVRNIALAVVARSVQWKSLKFMETVDTFFTLIRRLFVNLLNHSEKISEAMVTRGYRGDPSSHRIYFLKELSLTVWDKVAIVALLLLVVARFYSQTFLGA